MELKAYGVTRSMGGRSKLLPTIFLTLEGRLRV